MQRPRRGEKRSDLDGLRRPRSLGSDVIGRVSAGPGRALNIGGGGFHGQIRCRLCHGESAGDRGMGL